MKAEWDDAPLRVREKANHTGLIISMIATCGLAAGLSYLVAPDVTVETYTKAKDAAQQLLHIGDPETKPSSPPQDLQPTQTQNAYQQQSHINGEAVDSTPQQQQEQRVRQPSEGQTVFNDNNYQPRTNVNTMESRHVARNSQESIRRESAQQRRSEQSRGLNGRNNVTLKWRDARGRETFWYTSFTYRRSHIDNGSFCVNYGPGSIEYRTCRKAAKEWLKGRCGNGNRMQDDWQRMYCLAANGFRT